jgi:hypothetical protein
VVHRGENDLVEAILPPYGELTQAVVKGAVGQ